MSHSRSRESRPNRLAIRAPGRDGRRLPPTFASELEVLGDFNEDWLPILRIQRVLDADGIVLFDIETGADDQTVEAMIDEVNIEYLDLLLDLTGDDFMGAKPIGPERK